MQPSVRFLGIAAYELIAVNGKHIWVDPCLDGNVTSPVKSDAATPVDLILVTHGAFEHLGDAETLAKRTGAPVVCGSDVQQYLMARGLPETQVRAAGWGHAIEIAGVRVQPVESHHWSQVRLPDGSTASGPALAYVIELGMAMRFYHYGGTSLFRDLQLIGDLYKPTVCCLGVTNPLELSARLHGPGRVVTAAMTPREAAIAAQWLSLEAVLPCHYLTARSADVREFERLLLLAKEGGARVPHSLALNAGDVVELPLRFG